MKKADVVYHLAHHVGAANGISGQALARLVVGPGATAADERKLRDVIIERTATSWPRATRSS
jgi:hypothetical protein